MSCTTHCCVFTRGELFIRDVVTNCNDSIPDIICSKPYPFIKLGNISSAMVEIQASVIGKENEFNPVSPDSRVEILGVNMMLSLNCISKKNLARALFSSIEESESASHVQEYCIDSLDSCMFFAFNKKGVSSVEVFLKDNSDNVIGSLVQDTDFVFNSSGIQIIRDDIDLLGATTLRIQYDYDNTNYIDFEFNNSSQKYKELYFKGTNYGDSSESLFDANFYRVIFSSLNQFDLITRDEFFTINLAGSVEKLDGKWFKVTKQE